MVNIEFEGHMVLCLKEKCKQKVKVKLKFIHSLHEAPSLISTPCKNLYSLLYPGFASFYQGTESHLLLVDTTETIII